MKFLEYMMLEMSYTEIAGVLKREPKSIDNAIQRIKKKISIIINDYDNILINLIKEKLFEEISLFIF